MQADIFCVVRSAGERTEKLCVDMLRKQIPSENIVIINEKPFSKALATNFKLGIEKGAEWTLCIDADVLIADKTIDLFIKEAQSCPTNVFEIHSNMLDKFFGTVRQGGMKLYRTSLLPMALEMIPIQGRSIRPEHDTINAMAEKGHESRLTRIIVGLHDYEQYYRDIYRKILVHSHKHDYCLATLVLHWKHMANHDMDYRVALWAIEDSSKIKIPKDVEPGFFDNLFNEILAGKKMAEKNHNPPMYDGSKIRKLLDFIQNEEFFRTTFHKTRFRMIAKGEYSIGLVSLYRLAKIYHAIKRFLSFRLRKKA